MLKKIAALLLILALCLPFAAHAESGTVTLSDIDFTATLMDGSQFQLTEQMGRVIFINFWATWCPPCRSEMPDIDQLTADYAGAEDVVILTVSCGDLPEDVEDYLAENGFTLNVFCDERGELLNAYGFDSIPVTLIFNKNGELVTGWIGAREDLHEYVTTIIEEMR